MGEPHCLPLENGDVSRSIKLVSIPSALFKPVKTTGLFILTYISAHARQAVACESEAFVPGGRTVLRGEPVPTHWHASWQMPKMHRTRFAYLDIDCLMMFPFAPWLHCNYTIGRQRQALQPA